jgi:hypothetical protein
MQSYQVGQTEFSQWDAENLPSDAEWVAYDYEYSDYCGSGYAVCKCGNELLIYNLGHCSCYGPLEAPPQAKLSATDWFSTDIHTMPELSRVLIEKVNELLGAN